MADNSALADKLYPKFAETLKRESLYYEALGRFIDAFSQLETAMALTLWKYAGVSKALAPCVFSGVRAKEAGDHVKRILETTGATKDDQASFKYLTDQLGDLNSARNDLIHYGGNAVGSNEAYVTNALKAHTKAKETRFPVSPEILGKMRSDAVKITFHLTYEWLHREQPQPGTLSHGLLLAALQSPWQYKHQPRPENPKAGKGQKRPKERQK